MRRKLNHQSPQPRWTPQYSTSEARCTMMSPHREPFQPPTKWEFNQWASHSSYHCGARSSLAWRSGQQESQQTPPANNLICRGLKQAGASCCSLFQPRKLASDFLFPALYFYDKKSTLIAWGRISNWIWVLDRNKYFFCVCPEMINTPQRH